MRTPFNGLDELSASIAILVIGVIVFVALSIVYCGETEPPAASTLSQVEMHGPLIRLGQPSRLVSTLAPTPTPAPTPVPTLVPEREALAALVHETFPDDPYMGNHVVWHETLNLNNPEGLWREYVYGGRWSETGDCGLMQINWYYHSEKFAAHGWTEDDCFIPERNLVVAREIYEGAGCSAWSTCY